MENSFLKNTEDKTDKTLGVTGSRNLNLKNSENELAQGLGRGGRKGIAQPAQEHGTMPGEASTQARVIISQESNRDLDDLAIKVNEGFEAGKVTRPQILSWVLRRFAENAGEDEIQELRAAHFDRIAYLETLLKRAKETGVLPPELQAALQPPCISAQPTKKTKRALTKNIINGDMLNDDNNPN